MIGCAYLMKLIGLFRLSPLPTLRASLKYKVSNIAQSKPSFVAVNMSSSYKLLIMDPYLAASHPQGPPSERLRARRSLKPGLNFIGRNGAELLRDRTRCLKRRDLLWIPFLTIRGRVSSEMAPAYGLPLPYWGYGTLTD